jgi:hypothetical protein
MEEASVTLHFLKGHPHHQHVANNGGYDWNDGGWIGGNKKNQNMVQDSFCKGRGKWVQHVTYISNMAPLRFLLTGCDSTSTWDYVYEAKVDTGGWYESWTVKDVHRAVEQEMKMKLSFKVIGERHEYMWIDGVQLDVKELLM